MPANMLIKQMPDDLKIWIADEARRHHRSMNKEALALLASARTQRAGSPQADAGDVEGLLARFRALPDLDRRTAVEILGYDENGLPV
ncbi:MAG: FitA-like ribbon-helix-helix domain-containing protein [Burkholderiales bacterium]